MPLKMTRQTEAVLLAFLQKFDDSHYGLDLMKQTGLQSGTMYPILIRLEGHGLVKSFWETEDPVVMGRPKRRLYQLTGLGIKSAEDVKKLALGGLAHA